MSLQSDLIKHKIFVQRFAGTEFKHIDSALKELSKTAESLAGSGLPKNEVKRILRDKMATFHNDGIGRMSEFATYESDFTARVLERNLKTEIRKPSDETVINKLRKNNMEINNATRLKTRKSLETAYKQFGRRKADELAQIVADGQVKGLNTKEIQKNIKQRVRGAHRAQARSLANTSVNYSAVVANNATVEANRKIFDRVVWVSVLDGNTTEYCQDHDGNIYPIDEGPRPPAHWNCRSIVTPLTK